MAWLTWILKFKVLKTFITITRGLKITFVGRSHFAPGDKTVLSTKQPVTGDILCFKRHIRSIL